MEQYTEIKSYRVKMICDKCLEGEMIAYGYALICHPPKYPHRCKECGYEEIYTTNYPTTRFEEVK
jgi:hypothetical protein